MSPRRQQILAALRDPVLASLLALAVRVLHASFVAATPFFDGPVIDSLTYRELAKQIAAGGGLGGAFYQPPLYPVVWAAALDVGLGSSWGMVAIQSICGALTAGLVVVAARRLFAHAGPEHAERVGLVAGLAAALYGPLVLYDVELLPPALVHVCLAGALVLALGGRARPGVRDAGVGVLVGVATTGWTLSIVWALGLAALRAASIGRRRGALVAVALVCAGALVPIALVWRHNAREGAANVVVSYNGGINFWLGNNPRWRDTWRARPGAEFEPELERPDREGVTQPGERSRYFVRLAMRDVGRAPGAAIARTVEKLYYMLHGREIRRNQDFEILRDASPVLRVLQWELGLFFPFGLVAPLALIAIWRRRRERASAIVALTAGLYALAVVTFFVATRYRLPLVLLLLPFAADTAVFVARGGRLARGELAALAALAVVLNLPSSFTESFRATAAERGILTAQAWRSQGRLDRADAISERLVARYPANANVQMLRAEILDARGRCDLAIPHLERTASLAPRASTPWVVLGTCFANVGAFDRAERAYAQALARHPFHGIALRNAGVMYMRVGRREQAIALFRRFLRAGYEDDGLSFDLGRLLLETGRARDALEVLEPLARKSPRDTELRDLVRRARL